MEFIPHTAFCNNSFLFFRIGKKSLLPGVCSFSALQKLRHVSNEEHRMERAGRPPRDRAPGRSAVLLHRKAPSGRNGAFRTPGATLVPGDIYLFQRLRQMWKQLRVGDHFPSLSKGFPRWPARLPVFCSVWALEQPCPTELSRWWKCSVPALSSKAAT